MNRNTPSYTREDYLKAIFELTRDSEDSLALMGSISDLLGLTAGSVTTMVRRLATGGLVEYSPRSGCKLTDEGRKIALRILRRHRVIEAFLVRGLGMDWSCVHDEAESMEHGTSDEVIDRIWESLGFPVFDPHGGSIPDKELNLPDRSKEIPVSNLNDGESGVITRFSDRNPALLKAMRNAGLAPGARFVVKRNDGTGILQAVGPEGDLTISQDVASQIHCV